MSQNQKVLKELKRGPLTAQQAAHWLGVWRLAARIKDLRDKGHDIRTDMIGDNDVKYARYTLLSKGK